MNRILLLLLSASIACAQASLAPPRRGAMVDESGFLRPLLGVSGSLTAGAALRGGAVSAASAGRYTLVKTHTRVEVLLDEAPLWSGEAPPGPAVFGFGPGGSPALAYFASTGEVAVWDGSAFRGAWRVPDGRILAAAAPSRELALLAAAGGSEIRLETRSLRDGALLGVEALPGARAPVLLGAGGWKLFWDGEGLLAVPPGAAPERVALPCRPEPLEQAGDGLAAAYCGGRRFGVTLAPAGVRAFELPAAREEGSR